MATKFTCPGCDYSVFIPDTLASIIKEDVTKNVGCDNVEQHSKGESLCMWPDDDD